jgi:predicted transcriptional regulator
MVTKTQERIILLLLDDEGHAEWELAERLGMKDSNLNPMLRSLRGMGVIYRGESRRSGKKARRDGEYSESPYYLTRNLDALRTIIKEASECTSGYDIGFFLQAFKNSNYIKNMLDDFGEDVFKSMVEEMLRSYPACSNLYIAHVIRQNIQEIFGCVHEG